MPKLYIKPLSDEPNNEIGLVTGSTLALYDDSQLIEPNTAESYKETPA